MKVKVEINGVSVEIEHDVPYEKSVIYDELVTTTIDVLKDKILSILNDMTMPVG